MSMSLLINIRFFIVKCNVCLLLDPSIRLSNNKRYLAYCSLLCQIYIHVKTAPGKHLAVLETPVCTVLENLLDDNASDLEVEVAATQVQYVEHVFSRAYLMQKHEHQWTKHK